MKSSAYYTALQCEPENLNLRVSRDIVLVVVLSDDAVNNAVNVT
jgi:hypothetical protein